MSRRQVDPDALSPMRLAQRLQTASDHARGTYYDASAAYKNISAGAESGVRLTATERLIESVAAAAKLDSAAAHRSRYFEEFRAEVNDLPPSEHAGYALRQCLLALTPRPGLAAPSWSSRKDAADHADRSDQPGVDQ